MTAVAGPLTLLNFAPMIDSELSRLVLRHYRLPFVEQRHVFGWASVLALVRGGTVQVPLLYGRGVRLAGPRRIVDRFDPGAPPGHRLVPPEQPLGTQVEADWVAFNGRLATFTAAFAYFHLLPDRALMTEPFSRGVPAWEASALRGGFYSVLRGLLTTLLGLGPAAAEDALSQIRTTLDRVDARLADGRAFLHGDRLTLADLALASAIAPLLIPQGYGAPMPALEQMPRPMVSVIEETRARPVRMLVQRVYLHAGNHPQASDASP